MWDSNLDLSSVNVVDIDNTTNETIEQCTMTEDDVTFTFGMYSMKDKNVQFTYILKTDHSPQI